MSTTLMAKMEASADSCPGSLVLSCGTAPESQTLPHKYKEDTSDALSIIKLLRAYHI